MYAGSTFAGTIANVGNGPTGIAIDPRTDVAYVADYGYLDEPAHTVTPVDLSTGMPGHPIAVGNGPLAIALKPGGRDAVVTLQGTASSPGHQIREIDLATDAVSAPVDVGLNPESLAINPAGTMAYVAGFGSAEITPVNLTTWPPVAETPIPLPETAPRAIAIAPDGKWAYVLDAENATVIPINLTTEHVGTALNLVCHEQGDPGCTPDAITISPNGKTAYVAAAGSSDVMLLSLPSLSVAGVVQTGGYPDALGLSGRWLYVANGASNTMSVFPGLRSPASVGGVTYPFGVAVIPGTGDAASTATPELVHASSTAGSGVGQSAHTLLVRATPFYGFPAPGT
jgi:DNA-binding beta-propeller fold protein YncE